MAAKEEEERGFVIKDRRARYGDDDEVKTEVKENTLQSEGEATQSVASDPVTDTVSGAEREQSANPRELTFQSFIYSLASSALMFLGEEAKEGSKPTPPNLQQASEIIQILTMLQEKTRGNLTTEEDSLLKDMLYTLRITYVKQATPKP